VTDGDVSLKGLGVNGVTQSTPG